VRLLVHSQARARPAATILQLPLSNSFFRLTPDSLTAAGIPSRKLVKLGPL
jgi:hypothetical protein